MAASMKMLLCVQLVLLLSLCHVYGKDKPVTVTLNAKWTSTPLLLEASEFIAKENAESFWRFLSEVSKVPPNIISAETDQGYYHLIMKYAGKVLSVLQQQLLRFSLSLRTYSPTIEMYRQLAESENVPENCHAFVNVHGKVSCDPDHIEEFILDEVEERPMAKTFKFDHSYPGSASSPILVILYAELGKEGFREFHQVLQPMAEKNKIHYIFRHRFTSTTDKKTRLSGYGVELAIKSTEYKAKDDTKVEDTQTQESADDEGEDEVQGFVFSKLREQHPELTEELKAFRNHLVSTSSELAALKVWELQDLSLQASQKIVNAPEDDVLSVLTDISQNFPSRTRSLVKIGVSDGMKKEMKKNQEYFESSHGVAPGDSAMFLNGLPVEMEVYDIYTLIEIMRSEANLMEGLFSLGFKVRDVNQLLKLDLKGDVENFALDIRHSAVQYLNDLENDRKYKNWPSSLQDFLRPTFPGMLRHVAKNIFHLVFIVDPQDKESRELIKMAEAFAVHSAPIRIGVVYKVNFDPKVTGRDDGGVAISRAYDYLSREENPLKAISFVTDVFERTTSEITAALVIKEFKKNQKDADEDLVFGDSDEYDTMRKGAGDYVSKSGLKDFPQVLMNGVPMDTKHLNSDSFEEGVVSSILALTPAIQKDIYHGTLHDFMNVQEYLMEKDNVLPRLNSRVLSPKVETLDFISNIDPDLYFDPEMFALMSSKDMSSIMAQNMKYLTRKEDDDLVPVTLWIICDLETPQGRELLYSALKRLKYSHSMRIGIIFSSSSEASQSDRYITRAVYTALRTLTNNNARNLITKLVKEENVADLKAKTKSLQDMEVHGMDTMNYLMAVEAQNLDFLTVHETFVQKALKWNVSSRGFISNGQIIGPLDVDEKFLPEDIDLLEKYTLQRGGKKLKEQISSMGEIITGKSDLVMKVSSLLAGAESSTQERKQVQYGGDEHSVVKLPAKPDSPAYQIEVIVDPASRDAQKLAPILKVLRDAVNVDIRIYLNSRIKLSEMPVIVYYRYVLESDVRFKVDGSFTDGPHAKFTQLPQKSVLTLGMNAPEGWLVETVLAPYDMDNILIEEATGAIQADFDLEYLLLEGHCSDSSTGQPPRGLQFTLGRNDTGSQQDTLVMANLGYFQLKANPGTWILKLREGRSKDLYDIHSHELTDSPSDDENVVIVMNSFKSKIIRVKVAKKPDKMGEQLLQDDKDDKSLWQSISSTITGGEKKEEENDETLNIFSVASGHMYERLMRIMMLSVLKHTKSKVKFWFLKNYLSPSFKDFIPKMAKQYDFEFELVQYKWPRWLHQQKEKQRIMWGYKILFLDVLFPLDVKKIIFVDADQIVRTDLQELHDIDLEGAPYGYTPFCESRKDMDGFRFWKHGYWASHLAGRKYHISALYVVDLKKFRRIAAGDRLRGQYQGLSQDPNSLSNLDQDLPNNMIHQVSIKSLPQDWLWCGTWCDEKSLATAKTIDLCNNPETKEPKLKAALRIVPEWKEYDYEIKLLWDKVHGTNTREQIEYDPPDINTENIGSKIKDEL